MIYVTYWYLEVRALLPVPSGTPTIPYFTLPTLLPLHCHHPYDKRWTDKAYEDNPAPAPAPSPSPSPSSFYQAFLQIPEACSTMGFFKSLKGDHPQIIGGSSDSSPSRPLTSDSKAHQSHSQSTTGYEPPPGPPPRREESADPQGPPPSYPDTSAEPPPYHDWTIIPDTSLLPPPPGIRHGESPSGNASTSDADRALEW